MAFTQKTIQATYPGAGAGSRVLFALSQAMNDSAGTQIEAVTRTMYLDELTGAGSIILPANDDASTNPPGTYYIVTERINPGPERVYWITINAAATSPIQLATISHASGGTVTYGVSDITSSSLTVTHPSPGIVNIEDPGGGGGGAPPSTLTPLTDVTGGAVGTATPYSREDHRHPLSAAYATAAGLTAETTRATAAEGTNAAAITSEAATARAAEGTNATAITSETTARTAADITSRRETVNFTATGAAWYTAEGAETWDSVGTLAGTFTYAKSVAATPDTFSGTALPVVLAAGDTLQITCTALRTGPPARGIFRMRRTA